jgi:hypothetical protein
LSTSEFLIYISFETLIFEFCNRGKQKNSPQTPLETAWGCLATAHGRRRHPPLPRRSAARRSPTAGVPLVYPPPILSPPWPSHLQSVPVGRARSPTAWYASSWPPPCLEAEACAGQGYGRPFFEAEVADRRGGRGTQARRPCPPATAAPPADRCPRLQVINAPTYRCRCSAALARSAHYCAAGSLLSRSSPCVGVDFMR